MGDLSVDLKMGKSPKYTKLTVVEEKSGKDVEMVGMKEVGEVVVVEAVEGADDVCIVPEDMHYLTWLEANEYEVNARSIFSRTWEVYKAHWKVLVGGLLAVALAHCAVGPGSLLGSYMGYGYLVVVLNGLRPTNPTAFMKFNDMFSGFSVFVPLFGLMLTQGILMLTAVVFYALILLALIIKASAPVWVVIAVAIVLLYPLMYIGIGLHLAAPVLLEFHTRRIGVFASIGLAFKQMHRKFTSVILFVTVLSVISMLGALFGGIGALFTGSYALVACLTLFKDMFGLNAREYRAGECVVCV